MSSRRYTIRAGRAFAILRASPRLERFSNLEIRRELLSCEDEGITWRWRYIPKGARDGEMQIAPNHTYRYGNVGTQMHPVRLFSNSILARPAIRLINKQNEQLRFIRAKMCKEIRDDEKRLTRLSKAHKSLINLIKHTGEQNAGHCRS
jgi:hypothetical protein